MNAALRDIGGIGSFILLIGVVPAALWMLWLLCRRRWRPALSRVGIAAVFLACLFGLSSWLGARERAGRMARIFDTEVDLGPPIFSHPDDWIIPADSYVFSVYEMPPAVRRRFEAADARLLTEYPRPPEDRRNWRAEPWRPAPVAAGKPREDAEMLLGGEFRRAKPELYPHVEAARAALDRKGVYYAFFYPNSHDDEPFAMDFFLVDPAQNRIYIIRNRM